MLNRYRIRLLAIAITSSTLLGGCSLFGFADRTPSTRPVSQQRPAPTACQLNPQSCMYEGSYEQGEAAYAIQEAARLNQRELRRLQRMRF